MLDNLHATVCHLLLSSLQDMTLEGLSNLRNSNNLADPEVGHHGLLSRLLCSRYGYTTTHSCTTCHSLGHLQFLDIALNDLSDVYSASVSFMDSTDNLRMEEREAM